MYYFVDALPKQADNQKLVANSAPNHFQPWNKTLTMLQDFFLPHNKKLLDLIKDDRFKHWLRGPRSG